MEWEQHLGSAIALLLELNMDIGGLYMFYVLCVPNPAGYWFSSLLISRQIPVCSLIL